MSNFDNSPFDESGSSFQDFSSQPAPAPRPPKKKSKNQSFWIIITVLGLVLVLAVVAIVGLAMWLLPQRSSQQMEQAAQINAQNTATALAATREMLAATEAANTTATFEYTPTSKVSPTPVVVFASATITPTVTETATEGSEIGGPDQDAARTATLAYLLTQAAAGGGGNAQTQAAMGTTTIQATSTALPNTGWADEVGLPILLGMAVVFVILIFVVRKIRTAQ